MCELSTPCRSCSSSSSEKLDDRRARNDIPVVMACADWLENSAKGRNHLMTEALLEDRDAHRRGFYPKRNHDDPTDRPENR